MATHQPPGTPNELSLFTILLGSTPKGRNIEQHDVMFGVAHSLSELTDTMKNFWYGAIIAEIVAKVTKLSSFIDPAVLEEELKKSFTRRDKVHIDAWMNVKYVDGYRVIIKKKEEISEPGDLKLFFINLGGYKENEFEEYHKKLFVVAKAPSEAIAKASEHEFMTEYNAESLGHAGSAHLDDQHKINFEADDIICVSENVGGDYVIVLEPAEKMLPNETVIGYVKLPYDVIG